MKDLILEIYCEEIPARFQLSGLNELARLISKEFAAHHIKIEHIEQYVSPRRLSFILNNLPVCLPEFVREKKGPNSKAHKIIVDKFLDANNKTKQDLIIKTVKDKDFFFLQEIVPRQDVGVIIAEILPKILNKMVWPKSMRWGNYSIKWVRPIKNVMCIFGGDIVDFTFGHIRSNNLSYGHFFMNNQPFVVASVEQYKQTLNDRSVIFNHIERQESIKEQCYLISQKLGAELVDDQELFGEINGLVEMPNALLGHIDEKYMKLPDEVLLSSIKHHQKYICMHKSGKLIPYFIVISNIKTDNDDIIIAGNQKVLTARLEDALFFLQQDQKTAMIDKFNRLEGISFHTKLGTLANKITRIVQIASFINVNCNLGLLEQDIILASKLIKSDLTTEMVSEFPELQGIIGYYYALNDGIQYHIARSISQHYKPISADDSCPEDIFSSIMALSDKFDNLVGLWLAGEKPTGSKDPYALRRAALTLIKLLVEKKISIDLKYMIEFIISCYAEQNIICDQNSTTIEVMNFIIDRFKIYYKKQHIRYDVICAVTVNFTNVFLDSSKLIALNSYIQNSQNYSTIKALLRIINIVKNEQHKDKKIYDCNIDSKIFKLEVEKKLYKKFIELRKQNINYLKQLDYHNAISCNNLITDDINKFFDEVIVNDPDQDIRQSRLCLLAAIKNEIDKIADITVLEL